MSDNGKAASGGWFFSVLGLLFITLKLIGEHFHTPVADWSWWLVTLPLWGGVALFLAIVVGGILVIGAAHLVEHWLKKRADEARKQRLQPPLH